MTSEITIAPQKHWSPLNLSELYRYRELLFMLCWRDIAIRYKQTALGVSWALLQPFISMVVMTFVFNRIGNISSGDQTPYPIFLLVGLLFWQYFSTAVLNAGNSMVANVNMIQKVYFPRLIIPSAAAMTGLVDLALGGLILLGMMLYYGYYPRVLGICILPILLLTTFLTALGMGTFLAAVYIKYRDVRYAIPFIIQVLMFITPVVYPVTMLDRFPLLKALVIWTSPIAGVLANVRPALLGTGVIDWGVMAISLGMSIVICLFGVYYFRMTEGYFADIA